MGGNYEEVRKEIEDAVVKLMALVLEVSAQSKPKSLVYVQVSTPSRNGKEVEDTQ